MGSFSTNNPKWSLTQESFDFLLARLDADREKAGLRYEALRLKLNYFFETRNCLIPELLVDETFNRLARKITSEKEILNLEAYTLTIARFVWLESRREEISISLESVFEDDDQQIATQRERDEIARLNDEDRLNLMQQCVLALPAPMRQILHDYYQGTGAAQSEHRKQLAEKLGITENALYLKVFRVRQKLAATLAKKLNEK